MIAKKFQHLAVELRPVPILVPYIQAMRIQNAETRTDEAPAAPSHPNLVEKPQAGLHEPQRIRVCSVVGATELAHRTTRPSSPAPPTRSAPR